MPGKAKNLFSLYDFDGTIYLGDSSKDYALYCLRVKPQKLWVAAVFSCLLAGYYAGVVPKITAKGWWFRLMDDNPATLSKFWLHYKMKLFQDVLEMIKKDMAEGITAIIISSGPEFLIASLLPDLASPELLATKTKRGIPWVLKSPICFGQEKIKRFENFLSKRNCKLEDVDVKRVVSDSASDIPLYLLGGMPLNVDGGKILHGIPKKTHGKNN